MLKYVALLIFCFFISEVDNISWLLEYGIFRLVMVFNVYSYTYFTIHTGCKIKPMDIHSCYAFIASMAKLHILGFI